MFVRRPFYIAFVLSVLTALMPFFVSCNLFQSSDPDIPDYFLLSWQNDPSTSITIDWHPHADLTDEQEPSRLLYRQGLSGRFSSKRAGIVDVPYSNRWYTYMSVWAASMITPSGRVIPHVAAIGNHEVKRAYAHRYSSEEQAGADYAALEAPFYTTFVPFPGKQGYGVLDFGRYLSLIILDSGHLYPVEGVQTGWLAEKLARRADVTHIVPVYHVPAWPSHRNLTGSVERAVRTHWVPLFEKHGVRVAFEHHDHTYKRTHAIYENAVDEERGVVYVGDGAWGVETREPRRDEQGSLPWYLARAEPLRHFILVDLNGPDVHLRMYTEDGTLLDSW